MHNHAIFVHKNYIKIAHFSKFEQLKMARREGRLPRFLNRERDCSCLFLCVLAPQGIISPLLLECVGIRAKAGCILEGVV